MTVQTTALAVIEPYTPAEFNDAKAEIATAWQNCVQTEKYGLEFGRVCYEAQQKFRTAGGVGNKGKGITAIWQELNIPERTAYRWIAAWMESKGIVPFHIEKRKNRSEPPDSFEVLRGMAMKALTDGFKNVQGDPSHKYSALTWARCCLQEKITTRDSSETFQQEDVVEPQSFDAPEPTPETTSTKTRSENSLVDSPKKPSTEASVDDIRLELCSRTDPRYKVIRDEHYIENHGCIGQQAHFLIHYKQELVGIISGASPVFATSPRDKFFGIDSNNRGKFLQGIVNNVVFRLTNHEQNLATRVLSVWRNVIPHFWYENYGTVVYGFETFVVETDTRKGALYQADNWTLAGTTSGTTKVRNGIENPADKWKSVTPKLVYCRWRDGFDSPCSARTPDWVKRLYSSIRFTEQDDVDETQAVHDAGRQEF